MSRLHRASAAAVLAAAALALVPSSASAETYPCLYLGENEIRVDDVVVRYPWIKSRC